MYINNLRVFGLSSEVIFAIESYEVKSAGLHKHFNCSKDKKINAESKNSSKTN